MMYYITSRSCWISVLLLFYFYSVESKDHVCRHEAMFKATASKGKNKLFVLQVVKNITEPSACLNFLQKEAPLFFLIERLSLVFLHIAFISILNIINDCVLVETLILNDNEIIRNLHYFVLSLSFLVLILARN